MGKIFALIKNEWIKQYKKVSIKVILILIIIASFAAPFVLKYFNNSNDMKWTVDNYKHNIEWKQMEKDGLATEAKNYEISKKIIQLDIDMYNLKIDEKISWNDWRDQVLSEAVLNLKTIEILNGIKSGIPVNELLNGIYDFDHAYLEQFYSMSTEELEKEIETLSKKANDSYSVVKENNYMSYLSEVIKNSEKEIEENKKTLTAMNEELTKNKDDEKLKKQIDMISSSIKSMEETLAANKYRYDNNIEFDSNSWKHNTIEDVIASINVKSEELLNEEQFKQQFSYEINRNNYTYEKYKADRDARIAKAESDLKLDWYSLENNIPQVQYSNDARKSLQSTYIIYVNIAIILCIIIGGGIVSSEYSTGTVRLLMIRPVSRWKILLSKLVSVLMVGYGAMFVALLINIVSSGIAFSFKDLSIPIIALKEGVIVHQNFILSLMPNFLFVSISLIFIIAVVFTLSTVIKNTALAVGLTMVGFLGSMPATIVGGQLGMLWLDKTFIPYVNLTSYIDGGSFMIQQLKQAGMNLSATSGAIQLIVLSIILIGISFVVFSKRDVKN